MKLSDTQTLYVRSMGKALKVTAMFTDEDKANAYMAKPDNNGGVVAVFGKFILVADVYDNGVKIGA